ncbi:MAG TPA: sugar transferase [Mesorhizobium sp.]|jgi:O-antigen biosynthesis protein WbqP|uniref:sugar transferase n=1 Tax=Mesorhizobium sp. TaxID=1871066 RepID=UPI002DDDB51B|nr:sugar transferase [Mesorhizobium sp.]HEV2503149.1 sugar transferase [Mesorhizobium sp.]
MKRTFDFVAAALGLAVLWPVLLALVFIIKRGSEGPGIFSQVRVGRDCKPFRCHKLRSMRADTPNVPSHHATAGQITSIGHFIRKTKLDELPQLWNVLKGEMSFVGPRPCLPSQTELVEERQRRGVMTLRPGITGLAQINDIDMSNPIRLAAKDAEYLETHTFLGDFAIIFRTVFRGEGSGDRIR